MDAKSFNEIVLDMQEHCRNMLIPKGEEYSRNGDRLHSFKVQCKLSSIVETPIEAAWGNARKQLASILDMIEDEKQHKYPDDKMIMEKFGDMHNYLYLIEALIREARHNDSIRTRSRHGR